MSRLPDFYLDRQSVASLPDELVEELRGYGLIKADENVVSFSGVLFGCSGVSVFFPRNTDTGTIESSEKLRYSSLLMKGIRRYLEDTSNDNLGGDGAFGGLALQLIMSLLEDYCAYGLYSQRLRETVKNTGKPDWKKTIASEAAFSGAGRPVYLDIWGARRRYVSDCPVARIHADVIRELDQSFSWVITGSSESLGTGLEAIPPFYTDVDTKISLLKRELNKVYSERDIRLINLLIKYINHSNDKQLGQLMGLRHFHHMWEKMLDSSLKWVFPVNKLLAVPAYRYTDGSLIPAASKAQRTDTVLKSPDEKKFVVVDAKYYGAQAIGSAPGWGDIVKQFFYAKALRVYSGDAVIGNAFVFPGDGPLKTVHMVDRGDRAVQLDSDYPPINCFYVNPIELIEHYVSSRKLAKLSDDLMSSANDEMFS